MVWGCSFSAGLVLGNWRLTRCGKEGTDPIRAGRGGFYLHPCLWLCLWHPDFVTLQQQPAVCRSQEQSLGVTAGQAKELQQGEIR